MRFPRTYLFFLRYIVDTLFAPSILTIHSSQSMFKLLNKNHAVEHYWRGGVLYRKSSEEGSLYTTSVQLISTALFLRIPKKYCRCKISCKLIYFYMRRHFFFPYSKLSLLSFMLQFVRIFFYFNAKCQFV